jgi:chromosome partitioning protein
MSKRATIAIANQKGGVGKTTTAVNLSAGLSNLGFSVLLVDSDSQGNATSHLNFNKNEIPKTLDNLYYEEDLKTSDVILPRNGIDFLPAAEPLAYAQQKLVGVAGKEKILMERLEEVEANYDFIIIDCPPNLGFLTINAFSAATDMVIIVKPEYFALEGLKRISKTVKQVRKRLNDKIHISGYLITDFDARKNQHKGIRDSIRRSFGETVFQTVIRTNSKLSNCTSRGQTIFEYDPNSYGAVDYLNLAKEVGERYGRK